MKFQCQESCGGKCCKPWVDGEYGFVFLSQKDRMRLCAFLGKPIHEFARLEDFDSTRFSDKPVRAWILDNGAQCQFLKEGKCSVYEARPTQCRTFPFWPENLTNEIWTMLGEHCPGINVGEEIPQAKINLQLEEQEAADANLVTSSRN